MGASYTEQTENGNIEEQRGLLINAEDSEETKEKNYDVEQHKPPEIPDTKVYYEACFVVMPLFCGYACLFALQHQVKQIYKIGDDNSTSAHLFGVAASLVYMGNLIFRLGHNLIFAYFYPRTRVIISMVSMGISMGIISCLMFIPNREFSLFWVFLAYGCGGLGIGTFESNLLSTIIPLGKRTKLWAIIGMPLGVNVITVGGFILMQFGLYAGYIFLAVLVFDIVGICLFFARIWRDAGTGNAITLPQFFGHIRKWRHWLPVIKWHSLALMVDMLCVSMFAPGLVLYIYDGKYVNFGSHQLATYWMMAIYDFGFFIGDTLSRKIMYNIRTIFPFFFLILAISGVVCELSGVIYIVFLCPLLVAWCNGSIYSQANRHIDTHVAKDYSLIAFSFWLFIGDIGSVIGSNLISYANVEVRKFYHH